MAVRLAVDLPAPSPEAQAVSDALLTRILQAIEAAGGAIGFDTFMRMALYEPGLGYYSAGARKFGAEGDFVTAPETSALFGQCLGRQVAQILEACSGGDVLEFGAGSGRMAVDILTALRGMDQLPERYLIVEVSADLRERQQALIAKSLPDLVGRVRWLDAWPQAPVRGAVVANEVLDAMPVCRVRKHADGCWRQLLVGIDGSALALREQPLHADSPLNAAILAIEDQLGPLPAGYTTEVSSAIGPWLQSLAAVIADGAVLLIDYGYEQAEYYCPHRLDGTLLCHYRHRAHGDALRLVGLQDITASVNFTAVAEAAQDAGFDVAGYCTQAQFLLSMGITEMIAREVPDPFVQLQHAQQIKRLLLPGEMGERFKVLMLLRNLPQLRMAGLARGNGLHRL